MLTADPKTLSRIEPVVRRVMIVDANSASSRILADLLKGLGARDIVFEAEAKAVLDVAREFEPTLIILERTGPRLDGETLARAIRRSHLVCRKAPIIMVTAEATATNIKGARDAGVHEFMLKPFAAGDLTRRVVNVATRPRTWVEAVGYVGPDRRRFNSGDYQGPRKRSQETRAAAGEGEGDILEQARKIIVSALDQFDRDPDQARRAIAAQGDALKSLAVGKGLTRLAVASAELAAAAGSSFATADMLRGPATAVIAMTAQTAEAGKAA